MRIDDDSYVVAFYGNGHALEQQVWNYWIYRCAELTKLKGFDYFELKPTDSKAYLKPPVLVASKALAWAPVIHDLSQLS